MNNSAILASDTNSSLNKKAFRSSRWLPRTAITKAQKEKRWVPAAVVTPTASEHKTSEGAPHDREPNPFRFNIQGGRMPGPEDLHKRPEMCGNKNISYLEKKVLEYGSKPEDSTSILATAKIVECLAPSSRVYMVRATRVLYKKMQRNR